MRSRKHQHGVEKAMRDAMKADKARSTVGRISPNGLLEINRQRVKQALALRTHRPCPTCAGTGTIPSPEFLSINLLRRIEARAANGRLKGVRVGLHPELADALQNGRRQEIAALEREFDIRVEINATTSFHRSEEKLEWVVREAAQAPPALAAVSVADLAAGGAAPDQPEAEKRRKRRRGGRRRKDDKPGWGAGEDAAEPAAVPVALQEDLEPESEAEAPPAEEPAGEKKRKRRRGGRRHKKGQGAQNPAENPDSGAMPGSEAPAPGEAPSPGAVTEPAGGNAANRKKRRRHHRRRVPAAPGGTAQEGGAA